MNARDLRPYLGAHIGIRVTGGDIMTGILTKASRTSIELFEAYLVSPHVELGTTIINAAHIIHVQIIDRQEGTQ